MAEGWDVVGFDIEQHIYGEHRYPAQLVLQDILTLSGHQFRSKVALIVASPPCQFFSYTAMPWSRAKAIAVEVRADPVRLEKELALFNACVRIGKEAGCPIVIENVKGAQKWVGKAAAHFGSYYLWGDVPALMPMTTKAQKFNPDGTAHPPGSWFAIADSENRGSRATKNTGGSWFNIGSPGQKVTNQNPVHDGVKQSGISGTRANGKGDRWFQDGAAASGSKSSARKAASARIAKIPFPLATFIARTYLPATQ